MALSHRDKEMLAGYAAITAAELAEGGRLQRQKLGLMICAPIAIIIMIVFAVIVTAISIGKAYGATPPQAIRQNVPPSFRLSPSIPRLALGICLPMSRGTPKPLLAPGPVRVA